MVDSFCGVFDDSGSVLVRRLKNPKRCFGVAMLGLGVRDAGTCRC